MARILSSITTVIAIIWSVVLNPIVRGQEALPVPLPVEVTDARPKADRVLTDDLDPVLACLRIPSSLITREASESFQHSSSVDRVVLGTHARGTAVCSGQVHGGLRDREDGVEFVCNISGIVTSQTCGTNGPAIVAATSDTIYTAEKRILFDGRMLSSPPATISATTKVQITGIGSTTPRLLGRVVKRVASRRAAESLPEAQEITRQLTMSELQHHIDSEFATRLASQNRKLVERLTVLDAFPRTDYELSIRSQEEFIEILLTRSDSPLDQQFGHHTAQQTNRESLLLLPATERAVLWIQLADSHGLRPGSMADLRFGQVLNYLPLWLAAPLAKIKAENSAATPRFDLVRHENWFGFQFNPDTQQN